MTTKHEGGGEVTTSGLVRGALRRRIQSPEARVLGRGLSAVLPSRGDDQEPADLPLPDVAVDESGDTDEQPSRVYQRTGLLDRLKMSPAEYRPAGLATLMQAYDTVAGPAPAEAPAAGVAAAPTVAPEGEPGFPQADDFRIVLMDLDLIQPNPFVPLSRIDWVGLQRLRESIKAHGFLRPLVVMPSTLRDMRARQTYWLVSGERSWQVARLLGVDRVPVRIHDVSPREAIQMILADDWHIQRLLPTDQAKLCRVLTTQMGMSPTEVAERLAVDLGEVQSSLGFLDLDEEMQDSLDRGHITVEAARALLAVSDLDLRRRFWRYTVRYGWSAKRIEKAYLRRLEHQRTG